MSNTIAVMKDGKVEQIGAPRDIYERPATRFVAEFIGTSNFIAGSVASVDGSFVGVDTPIGRLRATCPRPVAIGAEVMIAIRPEQLVLTPSDSGSTSRPNIVEGTVRASAFLGEVLDHVVEINGVELKVRGNTVVAVATGNTVQIELPPEHCSVLAEA